MNLDFDRKQYDTFVAIFNCLILIGQNELNFGIGEGFLLGLKIVFGIKKEIIRYSNIEMIFQLPFL